MMEARKSRDDLRVGFDLNELQNVCGETQEEVGIRAYASIIRTHPAYVERCRFLKMSFAAILETFFV